MYGTIIALGSEANLVLKPYGYTDIEIGICAVSMLLMGVIGCLTISLYIKKTSNYKKAIRVISSLAVLVFIWFFLWLYASAMLGITIALIGLLGFVGSPLIPLCYDLGCQLAFPMGEAQVIGILNGTALFFTFITTLVISQVVGYGEKSNSLTVLIIFCVLMACGSFLFFHVKIDLKRKNL